MKKIFILLAIISTLLILSCSSFATENNSLYTDENGNFVSPDEFILSGEEPILIDDLDTYNDLYSDSYDYQAEFKEGFENQLTAFLDDSERETLEKYVVLEVSGDIKSEYTTDYYSYYLMKYQTVKVKAENGQTYSAIVILYSDLFESNNISRIKVGDTFYGYSFEVEKDSEEYNLLDHGFTDDTILFIQISQKDRSLGVILLIIFAVLLLLLYTGKHGLKLLIPIFVLVDLLYFVITPFIESGVNIYLLAGLSALELITLIAVLKNGTTRKSLVAIISSIVVVLIVVLIALLFVNTNSITGTGVLSPDYTYYDNTYYIVNVIRTTDNQAFYMATIIIISSVVASVLSSILVELSEKYAGTKDMINSIIEESKGKLPDYIMIITAIFLVNILPSVMENFYNHSVPSLTLDAEIVVTKLSVYLLVLISALIISPITAIISNLLMGNVEIKTIEEKSSK